MRIMNSGGVVRNIRSWGTIRLLQRAKANKTWHHYAECVQLHFILLLTHTCPHSHWTMDFDISPHTLSILQSELAKDPRVIRWTTLKLGDRIQQITKAPEKTILRDAHRPKLGADRHMSGWSSGASSSSESLLNLL